MASICPSFLYSRHHYKYSLNLRLSFANSSTGRCIKLNRHHSTIISALISYSSRHSLSNRGGFTKGKRREDEEEDGGQTRCVCNQQHHEGVMIQCETCKVWQHCPCVGLGDGAVTPDKYYCDSCRPQNHPYKVLNGMLVSNASSTIALKTKSPKKRNTMNSKDASMPLDSSSQLHKWDATDSMANDSTDDTTRSTKRRRKTESTSDDNNVNGPEPFEDDDDAADRDFGDSNQTEDNSSGSNESHPVTSHHTYHNKVKSKSSSNHAESNPSADYVSREKHQGHQRASPHSSRKSSSAQNGARSSKHKKSASKPINTIERHGSSSPGSSAEHSDPIIHSRHSNGHATATSKNSRPRGEDAAVDDGHPAVVPSTKRRKTAKSENWSRDDSFPPEDSEYTTGSSSKKDISDTRSKKNGITSRGSKRHSAGSDQEHHDDDSNTLDTHLSTSTRTGNNPQSPTVVSKKSFSRRNHQKACSRHSTPIPGGDEVTPQPMLPSQPAAVRYPSAKMSLQDMTKRAKQLLDYITRVQIDMADRKNKLGTLTSVVTASSSLSIRDVCLPKLCTDKMNGQTPTPTHTKEPVNGDNQVCPNSARSSIDGTLDAPPSELKALDTKGGEADTLALTELDSRLLNSASHSHGAHDSKLALTMVNGVFPLGGAIHIPATHSPSIEGQGETQNDLVPGSAAGEVEKMPRRVPSNDAADQEKLGLSTSLELMDKLSGDLIRFQERFSAQF
ncbi:hypothetical protein BG004_005678 [Podila humilis]|nr:hypothetical protein BG004_005678 [Podila humilis]